MPDDVKQSLSDIMNAMDKLNHIFEEKLSHLRQQDADEADLGSLEKGILAMKDAGRIYLTWADHFIERLNEVESYDPMVD